MQQGDTTTGKCMSRPDSQMEATMVMLLPSDMIMTFQAVSFKVSLQAGEWSYWIEHHSQALSAEEEVEVGPLG